MAPCRAFRESANKEKEETKPPHLMSWPQPYRSWQCRQRKQGGQACIVSREDDNVFFLMKLHATLTGLTFICANLSIAFTQPRLCKLTFYL